MCAERRRVNRSFHSFRFRGRRHAGQVHVGVLSDGDFTGSLSPRLASRSSRARSQGVIIIVVCTESCEGELRYSDAIRYDALYSKDWICS